MGCGGAVAGHATPTPGVTHAVSSGQRCAALAGRGISPCPPNDLSWLRAAITDQVEGRVSAGDVRRWGEAALRSQTYVNWADQQMADGFLTSGAVADPSASRTNLFRDSLSWMQQARTAGGMLVFQPLRLTSLKLVAIPAELQAAIKNQLMIPSSYGWVMSFAGPGSAVLRRPDGSQTQLWRADASQGSLVLIWGQFKQDRELGPLWYEDGYYGCQYAQVQSVCG